jgi:hypothetical protein
MIVGWVVNVRFQVLTAPSMKMTAFRDVAPCSLVEVDGCFRGAYCLHLQGWATATRLHGATSLKVVILVLYIVDRKRSRRKLSWPTLRYDSSIYFGEL